MLEIIERKFKNNAKRDVLLKNLTTFKIGGRCKLLVKVCNMSDLMWLLNVLRKGNIRFFVLGGGSNVLFSDSGFDGVVVKLSGKFQEIKIKNNILTVGAGVSLFNLAKFCADHGLCGLEWAYGIPGSVGGATLMNAGAYGKQFSDSIVSVDCLSQNLKKLKLSNKACCFSYRKSIFQTNKLIITSVELSVAQSDGSLVVQKQKEYLKKRLASQPSYPSAGSIFKRCGDIPVSKLIDDLHLKGFCVGDAQVSKKHAGFIINVGSASCNDVLNLIEYIKQKLDSHYNVRPKLEIIVVEE